jgi:hypothetical protein
MLARLSSRLTYANVMATIALFVALGGGAYAAGVLPANSVGTKQLKKNAVTAAKVKDGSLLETDFKTGQLPAGARGAAGLKGDTGAKGDTGPAGPKGDQGQKGDTGDVGPTASTDATNGTDVLVPAGGAVVTAVDLASVTNGAGDRQITTTFPGRIMVVGQTSVYSNGVNSPGQAYCRLQISDGSGPNNGLTDVGQLGRFNFPATQLYTNLFSLSGSAVKPAGTYNVKLVCGDLSVANGLTASLSNLIVWAVKQ